MTTLVADLTDPTTWHRYLEDFDTFDLTQWIITTVQSGGGTTSEALADGDGGWLQITTGSSDNDSDALQKVGEGFRFAAGKRAYFKARFKLSDATQTDLVLGLQITDSTPFDVTDGVYFQKDDGDAFLDFRVEKNNTATAVTGVATLADDTFVVAAFAYDGGSALRVYVDEVQVATVATTNLPDDEDLTVSFALQNGEAASKTLTLDYIFAAKER